MRYWVVLAMIVISNLSYGCTTEGCKEGVAYYAKLGRTVQALAGTAALPAADLVESKHVLQTNGEDLGLVNDLTGKSIPNQISVMEAEGANVLQTFLNMIRLESDMTPDGGAIQHRDTQILQSSYQQFQQLAQTERLSAQSTAFNSEQLLGVGAAVGAGATIMMQALDESEE